MRGCVLLCCGLTWCGAAVARPVCLPGTLASYVALGDEGCSFGKAVFSGFQYSAQQRDAVAPGAVEIGVTPSLTALTVSAGEMRPMSGFGLDFAIGRDVMPAIDRSRGEVDFIQPEMQLQIAYRVMSEGAGIHGAALAAGVNADVMATAVASLDVNDAWCTAVDGTGYPMSGRACAFSREQSIQVLQTVMLRAGGAPLAGAGIDEVANRFLASPEPGTALLVLIASALAWTITRRRANRSGKLRDVA